MISFWGGFAMPTDMTSSEKPELEADNFACSASRVGLLVVLSLPHTVILGQVDGASPANYTSQNCLCTCNYLKKFG